MLLLFVYCPLQRTISCYDYTEVDYALENIDKRMVIGPYEQYGRALDVPAKRGKVIGHCCVVLGRCLLFMLAASIQPHCRFECQLTVERSGATHVRSHRVRS